MHNEEVHGGERTFGSNAVRKVVRGSFREGCKASAGDQALSMAHDVLMDILLLAKCDMLLHSASGVSEMAIYFNPGLQSRSLNLAYVRGFDRNDWLAQLSRGGAAFARGG